MLQNIEIAEHDNTIILPARVRSPKDNASVEGSVNIVSTWTIQGLRNMKFFSMEELNNEIRKKLNQLNNRPFQSRKGSRWSAFLEDEKLALFPLPTTPYRLSEWRTAKVRSDYHMIVCFYSVHHELIGNEVGVKVSDSIIEIYFNNVRASSHQTSYGKYGQFYTLQEHKSDDHRLFLNKRPMSHLNGQ